MIHVPKTAGSAVKQTLLLNEKGQSGMKGTSNASKEGWHFETRAGRRVRFIARGHCPASKFPTRGPNVFKVATLREPVERFISAFNFVREGGVNHPNQGAVQQARNWAPFLQKHESIEDFLKHPKDLRTIMAPNTGHTHFGHLMSWLTNSRHELDIDFYIRQEHVHEDFATLFNTLDIPLSRQQVDKWNVTRTKPPVKPNVRKRLMELLAEDINLYKKILSTNTATVDTFQTKGTCVFETKRNQSP